MLQAYSAPPAYQVALTALEAGIGVLPMRADGSKQPALMGWKEFQRRLASPSEIRSWFRTPHLGLALVTGSVSGGLAALDFDDAATFSSWLALIQRDPQLSRLYEFLAAGYEERSPKQGRHLLFRCPGVVEGSQKLALRPVCGPQRFETLAETREEGGLIIIDPSRGGVHPSGRPYVRLRGSVSTIRTITVEERTRLYESVRAFDEVPPTARPCRESSGAFQPGSPHVQGQADAGQRPGDLFDADPGVTWESLLIPLGWDLTRTDEKGEGYWRHPGKVGPTHSATTNADGTNRLWCFSASSGLPTERYLTRFEFYAFWHHGGDFKAAAKALAALGYTTRRREVAPC
jgi:putative DNA primase/helicase